MAANSKVIALLSVGLSLATSGAVAALAMGRDHTTPRAIEAEELCPPGACTIVTKSPDVGRPSVVYNVPVPASTVRPAVRSSPVMVAAAEEAR